MPHEVWFVKKNFIVHLRVFGCDDLMHVPKENSKNNDNKEKKAIFFGYKEGEKVYKLWNLLSMNIVYSQDVVIG